MRPHAGLAVACSAVVAAMIVSPGTGYAHKNITSPYTFADDVAPILREHCTACHVSGSAAPMSLLTYEETWPWADSMRLELVAGHMPPSGVESGASRFTNVKSLTARELNVLLTWASGGVPPGTSAAPPTPPGASTRTWPLGEPDLRLQPAAEFVMPAAEQEHVEEFRFDTGTTETRWLRAVDVLPGDPTVVRHATVSVARDPNSRSSDENVLALWVPGEAPVPTREDTGFFLPAGARLVLRVHYKKTWQRERDVVRDRSTVGLYFAPAPTRHLEAVSLEPRPSELGARGHGTLEFSRVVDEDATAVAVYADPDVHDAGVDVRAVRPDGSRETLIAFRPLNGWARRYWFRQPVALPKGTRLEVRFDTANESALLPPSAQGPTPMDITRARVTVNVLSSRRAP